MCVRCLARHQGLKAIWLIGEYVIDTAWHRLPLNSSSLLAPYANGGPSSGEITVQKLLSIFRDIKQFTMARRATTERKEEKWERSLHRNDFDDNFFLSRWTLNVMSSEKTMKVMAQLYAVRIWCGGWSSKEIMQCAQKTLLWHFVHAISFVSLLPYTAIKFMAFVVTRNGFFGWISGGCYKFYVLGFRGSKCALDVARLPFEVMPR